MNNRSVLIAVNGWWVHPNWRNPAFDAVMERARHGKTPATRRRPRIVEPTLAHLRATGR